MDIFKTYIYIYICRVSLMSVTFASQHKFWIDGAPVERGKAMTYIMNPGLGTCGWFSLPASKLGQNCNQK